MEHPIYELQRLVREHEMALSKVGAYFGSDVQKTLAHIKDYVHGVMDALPTEDADVTDQELADMERRKAEADVSKGQSIDKAKKDNDGPAPDVTKMTFAEANAQQPQ